ncbi:hypothetical protein LH425_08815 [Laribacter hongkongensis]|uniref:hypothetical protein n=1 Tax=Laribacter hongkongensis TaxID=168471 RepID=UPI001B4F3EF0|nr:hypothetical protein [Laribacter hongkongensis]MBP9527361.1 hypothetical protein [Laribacter sp.]MCG9065141.1 hypothetical protein [Laribacter hongkongensis]
MSKPIMRTDKWPLQATASQRQMMQQTLHQYRAFCRALSCVVLNNWPALNRASSFALAVERLVHPTAKNPSPRHRYFAQKFYKFPSYLRRAAIEFAHGQVSSYLTRYRDWQGGARSRRSTRPPVFKSAGGMLPCHVSRAAVQAGCAVHRRQSQAVGRA